MKKKNMTEDEAFQEAQEYNRMMKLEGEEKKRLQMEKEAPMRILFTMEQLNTRVIDPGTSYSDGGCSDYRTLEYHNNSCKELQSKFPQFVRLKENTVKTGPWKGIVKLGAYVQWKKAYQSSQVNTLESFME